MEVRPAERAMTKKQDEIVDAMGDIVAANTLAMQLLVLALERSGALEEGAYAAMIDEYLASDAASMFPDREGMNSLLGDLRDALSQETEN